MKSLGNTVVFDERVDPATADLDGILARLQKDRCDTVFANLPASSAASLIGALRKAGYKGHVLIGDAIFPPDLQALGASAEGVHALQSWSDDEGFKQLYVSKYGGAPDGVTLGAAALGYDAIACISESERPLSADSIKYSLLSKPCEGFTGRTGFSGLRIAQRRKRVVMVKDGHFVSAE